MKGNRMKTNSQWAQSSLKKDLIEVDQKGATKEQLALGLGPRKQKNAD